MTEVGSTKFDLVIFDLDGTLANTSGLIFDSFNFIMRKYRSLEMSPEQIMSYFGPPEEIAIKNIMGDESFDSVWHDYLEYYEGHLSQTQVFAGIPELTKDLKESGARLAIFTGKGDDTTELTLRYHGLRDMFDLVVTGSVVANHKPDPEGVALALKRLQVLPSRAVLVGDSLSDYKAARAAGVHFIAALYDRLAKNRFDELDCAKASSVKRLSQMLFNENHQSGVR